MSARWWGVGRVVAAVAVALAVVACGDGFAFGGDASELAAEAATAAVEGAELVDAARPVGLADELTSEVRALREWWSLAAALYLALLVAGAWLLSRLLIALVRLADPGASGRLRWLDNLGMLARLLIWVWVLGAAVYPAWRAAPLLTLFGAGVLLIALLIGMVRHFENLSTGIGLALRGRIRVGDPLTVGDRSGMVRAVGLLHVHLRAADGSTVFVPNRLLAGEAVTIGRARNSYPLRVRVAGAGRWSPADVETARWIASLSPYRDVHSRVAVGAEGADARVLSIELQVWSPRLLEAAEKHLRELLARHLAAARSPDAGDGDDDLVDA